MPTGLRIVAGSLRGRRIKLPRGAPVRPTSERVREALFSILAPRIESAKVLDLYAGSGALGIEALSRGAGSATFVEADRPTARALRASLESLGLDDRSRIHEAPVRELLDTGAVPGAYDLILADPPYRGDECTRFLELPGLARWLAADGLLTLEIDVRTETPERTAGGLERFRQARYGGTRVDFYRASGAG